MLAGAILVAACGSGHASRDPSTSTVPKSTGVPAPTTVASPPGSSAATSIPPLAAPQRYESSLPIAIQEAAAASAGDRLYVAGGYDSARNSSAAVFVLTGSTWQRGPSLPIAVNHPGAAAVGGDVYVAGGFTTDGAATNRAFLLVPGARSWREIAPMRHARGALALLAIDRHLYAIGGRDGTVQVAPPESYDPATGTWADLPAMPAPRNHVAGYVDGARACVAGGRGPDTSAAIDCYDPRARTWAPRATLPTATSGAAAVAVGRVTVVAGGEPAGETTIVGVLQVLRDGAWSTTPMLVPRHGTAFATHRGRLWACGGATAAGFRAVASCTSIAER